MSDVEARIAKINEQINAIMGRPSYGTTPKWQQDVAELRMAIEQLKSGKKVPRKGFERVTINPNAGAAALAVASAEAATEEEEEHHEEHGHASYILIFVLLAGLTLIELAWVPITRMALGHTDLRTVLLWVGLSGMALVKAVLVALYYMHLAMERKVMYALLTIPVILVVVMGCLVAPDAIEAFKRATF